ALGVTTLTASATDALGNTAQAAFTITVVPTTPPTLSLPNNLVVEAGTARGAVVTLPQATATSPLDPSPHVSQDRLSGFFPLGTTTVHVTATDAAGNTAHGAFTVTVVDTTAPTISPPADLLVEADVTGGALVTLPQATAVDLADPDSGVTSDRSSGF